MIDSFMHINNFEPYSTLEENKVFLRIVNIYLFSLFRFIIAELYMFTYLFTYVVIISFLNLYVNDVRIVKKEKTGFG